MTRVIEVPEALELLERAVQEKGADYIDPSAVKANGCEYATDDGLPSCIVGHVFYYLGVDPSKVNNGSVRVVIDNGGIVALSGEYIDDSPTFSYGAVSVLQEAQIVQDTKGTWGAALAEAKRSAMGVSA